MGMVKTYTVAKCGVLVALVARHYYDTLGVGNVFSAVGCRTCSLVGYDLLHGSEDIVLIGRGRFLVSS